MIPDRYLKYIFVPLLAFLITYVLTPWVRALARRYGWMDQPDERRIHDHPAPRGGGLAVWIGFHIGCAAIFFMPWGTFGIRLEADWWYSFLVLSGLLVLIGLIDDRIALSARLKLIGQIAVAALAYAWGFRAESLLGIPMHPVLDFLFTTVWIVGAINAFNLIDGMDGIASGLAIVAALAMAGQSLLQGFPGDALVALALVGACAAFLRYNFHPASIFLGDTGSMFLGLTIAVLALKTSAEATTLAALLIPLLAVGVPAFDALLAIWRRSVRQATADNEATGVFSADTDHLHHRLRRTGFSQRKVAVLLYSLAASLVVIGFIAMFFQARARSLYFITFLGAIYLIVRHLARVELWETGLAILKGIQKPERRVLSTLLYPVVDLMLLLGTAMLMWSLTHEHWLFARVGAGAVPFLGLWLAIPFILLVLTRTYQRVWSLARPLEFAGLWIALGVGGGLAAVSTEWPDHAAHSPWNHWLIFMGICGIGMIAVRAFPRLTRDLMAQFREIYDSRVSDIRRTALYGEGDSVALFLRTHSQNLPHEGIHEHLVGILTDDTNLHGRRICGLRVLGKLDQLGTVTQTHDIERIIVLGDLSPDRQTTLETHAKRHGTRIYTWSAQLLPISSCQ